MCTVNFLCSKILEVSDGDPFSLKTFSFQALSHNDSPVCILKGFSDDSETLCGLNLPGIKPVVKTLSSIKEDPESFCVSCLTSEHDVKNITGAVMQHGNENYVPGFRALIDFSLKPVFSLTFTLREKFKLYNAFRLFLREDVVHRPGHEPSFEVTTFSLKLVKFLKREIELLREEIFKDSSFESLAFDCALNDFYAKEQESVYSVEELQTLCEKFKLVSSYRIFFNDVNDDKLKAQVKKDCALKQYKAFREHELLYLYNLVASNIYYHPSHAEFKSFSLAVQGKNKAFYLNAFSSNKIISWTDSFNDKYSSLLSLYTVLTEDGVYALIPNALTARIITGFTSSVSIVSCSKLTNENLLRVVEVAVKLFDEGMNEFSLSECLNHALLLE